MLSLPSLAILLTIAATFRSLQNTATLFPLLSYSSFPTALALQSSNVSILQCSLSSCSKRLIQSNGSSLGTVVFLALLIMSMSLQYSIWKRLSFAQPNISFRSFVLLASKIQFKQFISLPVLTFTLELLFLLSRAISLQAYPSPMSFASDKGPQNEGFISRFYAITSLDMSLFGLVEWMMIASFYR